MELKIDLCVNIQSHKFWMLYRNIYIGRYLLKGILCIKLIRKFIIKDYPAYFRHFQGMLHMSLYYRDDGAYLDPLE